MFAFSTFTRAYEREMQDNRERGWKGPEDVKKLGIFAGEGSAVNLPLDSGGHPQYSSGLRDAVNRNPPFLSHITCGKYSFIFVGTVIYEHCWCKLGNYANVMVMSAERPYCDHHKLGKICIQGGDFCSVEINHRYADKPDCPDIGIIGGQFDLKLEISNCSTNLEVTAIDVPVRIFIDGTELPVSVTPEMGEKRLTLNAIQESRWHPVKVLRRVLKGLKQERNNSDEIRIKA